MSSLFSPPSMPAPPPPPEPPAKVDYARAEALSEEALKKERLKRKGRGYPAKPTSLRNGHAAKSAWSLSMMALRYRL